MVTELQWTADLGRNVLLRTDTMDRQVWADTFTGRYHLPPPMPTPARVLDAGCNIGLTVAHYMRTWPGCRVVGVEMDAGCVALARLNAPHADIVEAAVGAHNGTGSYNPTVPSDSYALGAPGRTVTVRTLHDLITDRLGDEADLVKMDIEGAEWDVFSGPDDWVAVTKHLLVELHGPGGSAHLVEAAVEQLTRLGFTAEHHTPHPQAVWATR